MWKGHELLPMTVWPGNDLVKPCSDPARAGTSLLGSGDFKGPSGSRMRSGSYCVCLKENPYVNRVILNCGWIIKIESSSNGA